MTKREKILAMAVGSLALVMGAVYLFNSISTSFDRKSTELLDLEQTISQQKRTVMFGNEARGRMKNLVTRSLPSDRALARSNYTAWLLNHAVDAGFTSVKVTPVVGRSQGDVYYEHTFLVSGFGSLKELTEFLYNFYEVDYLHRIDSLRAKPITGSKQLDLSITVDALSLTNADENQSLADPPANRLAYGEVENYLEAIVNRNQFAPANKPPQLVSPGSVEGNPNLAMSFTLTGSDPDEDDLRFEFDGTPPEGARIDTSSGTVRWTPPEIGEYEIAVRVTDTGFPPQSDSKIVKLVVVDPPVATAPSAIFDPATQAVITGITQIGHEREIWVSVRTEGKVLRLREGDQLNVGSILGVVSRIRMSEAEIKTNDGRTIIVGLGKSLVDDSIRDI
jgi:hypothetical protein